MSEPIDRPLRDFGYYYSEWTWPPHAADWMKGLLLFFDGIAIAVPPPIAQGIIDRDHVLAQPLAEAGLLVNFEPDKFLDRSSAERIIDLLLGLLSFPQKSSAEDWWETGRVWTPRVRSADHFGASLAPEAANLLFETLRDRDLVDGDLSDSIVRMNPTVCTLILLLFANALKDRLRESAIDLHPTTDQKELIEPLESVLYAYQRLTATVEEKTSAISVLGDYGYAQDLIDLGVDLSAVPLNEILAFRQQYAEHYRAYMRGVRQFYERVVLLPWEEQDKAIELRVEEIRDQLADLQRLSRASFRRTSSTFVLSLAGSIWTVRTGDPIGAFLAAGAAAASFSTGPKAVGIYSYLAEIRSLER